MEELKPCPFCGHKAELHHTYQWFVQCQSNLCKATSPEEAPMDEDGVIKAWNTHPTQNQARGR